MTLDVALIDGRGTDPQPRNALNDAVVEKLESGHTVRVAVVDRAAAARHQLRRRRVDRGHADGIDRLQPLGRWPGRQSPARGAAGDAGGRPLAVRPTAGRRRPTRSCASRSRTARPCWGSTASTAGIWLGRRHRGMPDRRPAGPARHLRRAGLLASDHGQVRARLTGVGAVLVELHRPRPRGHRGPHLVLGAGMTVLTGETGAGKTLVVEAIELLVGGRADAVAGSTRRRRGVGRGPVRDRRRDRGRPGPGGSRQRAEPGLRRRAHGPGRRPGRAGAQPGRPPRPARPPVVAAARPCSAAPSTPTPVSTGPAPGGPGAGAGHRRGARRASGGDVRARAREIDLLRFQLDELDRARHQRPGRGGRPRA